MNWFCSRLTAALAITLMPCASYLAVARAAESPTATASPLEAAIDREANATIKAFNAGDAAALGAMFLDGGELVDEQGTVHAGRQAIASLFDGFFKKFPKAVLEMQPTSTRPVGDALVVEEGERRITTAEGAASAQVRYVVVRSKQGDRWPIASYHEFADDPLPTPREMLQSAAWLVGDWVDEGPAGRTAVTFRWSDDGNFLLGDYEISGPDQEARFADAAIAPPFEEAGQRNRGQRVAAFVKRNGLGRCHRIGDVTARFGKFGNGEGPDDALFITRHQFRFGTTPDSAAGDDMKLQPVVNASSGRPARRRMPTCVPDCRSCALPGGPGG